MKIQRHSIPVTVEAADIDFMGHVNNAIYLKWVQAAVLSHWHSLAPSAAIKAYAWIALKHEITYRKPAFLEDAPVVSVFLKEVRGYSAYYETVIRRDQDVLADVMSRWCCLDASTRQPARLPKEVLNRFVRYEAQAE
jgi:acyl-CoA thioester hydrolase